MKLVKDIIKLFLIVFVIALFLTSLTMLVALLCWSFIMWMPPNPYFWQWNALGRTLLLIVFCAWLFETARGLWKTYNKNKELAEAGTQTKSRKEPKKTTKANKDVH